MSNHSFSRNVAEISKAAAWLRETLALCRYAVNANALREYEHQCQMAYLAFEQGRQAPVQYPLSAVLGLPTILLDNLIADARSEGFETRCVGDVYRRNLEGDLLSPWELKRYFVASTHEKMDVSSIPLSATEEDAMVVAALAWAKAVKSNRDEDL